MKRNVLFLCTGNSCRSQMAEGWGRALKTGSFDFFSAGTEKHGINPNAVKVMQECGIDISSHQSNTTDELPDKQMHFVFTVCSDAHEKCPFFPGGKIVHVSFDDPPKLTKKMTDKEEILATYRRVRDEIKEMIENIERYMEGK